MSILLYCEYALLILSGLSSLLLLLEDHRELEDQYRTTFQVYQQNKRQTSDNQTPSDSESEDDDSSIRLEPISIELVIRKIRTYTECLQDIGQSLDHPALDNSDDEETPFSKIDLCSTEDYHAERLRAKFPTAEMNMLQCLGRMSWHRYQRVQKGRKRNAQRQNVVVLDGKSSAVNTEFVDSGLDTSLPAAASSHAAIKKSIMASVNDGKQIHIPPLSAEAKDGHPFECVACGDLVCYTKDHDWRSVALCSVYDRKRSTEPGNTCTRICSPTLAFSQTAPSAQPLSRTARIGPHIYDFSTRSDRIGRESNARFVPKSLLKGRKQQSITSLGIWKISLPQHCLRILTRVQSPTQIHRWIRQQDL